MKKIYTEREKEIWKRGKIAGYYAQKAKERREVYKCKSNHDNVNKAKYNNFNSQDAFEAALKRSYGNENKS